MVKLRRVYEYLCFESEKDKEDLKNHLGDALFDDYMKIRDRIPKSQNDYKDFQKLKKLPIKDVQDFVYNFQSKSDKKKRDKQEGAEKLYEDSDWVVYKITSYPAAQLYGKGTKWCITGRYPGHEGRGEEYFNDYIEENDLDGGYYFYINKKDPKEKYCVLQTKDKEIHSIWDADDENRGSSGQDIFLRKNIILPEVSEVSLEPVSNSLKDNVLLIDAIDKGDIELVTSLLKKGSDANFVDDPSGFYNSPLGRAYRNENTEIMELLLKNGANPDTYYINFSGGTVPILLSAVSKGQESIIKLLLKYGANPDYKEYRIYTPLFISVLKGKLNIAKLLLEAGADPNFRDNNDDTPLSIAKENGDKKMIELLKKYWAKE